MRWPRRPSLADCPVLRAWLCWWLRRYSLVATRPGWSVLGMCLLERQVVGPPCPAGQEVNERVGQRRFLAGMYQRGHVCSRSAIRRIAVAAGRRKVRPSSGATPRPSPGAIGMSPLPIGSPGNGTASQASLYQEGTLRWLRRRQRPGRLLRLVVRHGDDCFGGNVIIALVTRRQFRFHTALGGRI